MDIGVSGDVISINEEGEKGGETKTKVEQLRALHFPSSF
jgi:hypothetical protein